jgi:hypothetical protein
LKTSFLCLNTVYFVFLCLCTENIHKTQHFLYLIVWIWIEHFKVWFIQEKYKSSFPKAWFIFLKVWIMLKLNMVKFHQSFSKYDSYFLKLESFLLSFEETWAFLRKYWKILTKKVFTKVFTRDGILFPIREVFKLPEVEIFKKHALMKSNNKKA